MLFRSKIRRAVTDCDNSVVYDPENKPGVANLMSIMSALTGRSMDDISADKAYLQQVMDSGRDRASAIAHRTMLKVRKKLGIAPWKL